MHWTRIEDEEEEDSQRCEWKKTLDSIIKVKVKMKKTKKKKYKINNIEDIKNKKGEDFPRSKWKKPLEGI